MSRVRQEFQLIAFAGIDRDPEILPMDHAAPDDALEAFHMTELREGETIIAETRLAELTECEARFRAEKLEELQRRLDAAIFDLANVTRLEERMREFNAVVGWDDQREVFSLQYFPRRPAASLVELGKALLVSGA